MEYHLFLIFPDFVNFVKGTCYQLNVSVSANLFQMCALLENGISIESLSLGILRTVTGL